MALFGNSTIYTWISLLHTLNNKDKPKHSFLIYARQINLIRDFCWHIELSLLFFPNIPSWILWFQMAHLDKYSVLTSWMNMFSVEKSNENYHCKLGLIFIVKMTRLRVSKYLSFGDFSAFLRGTFNCKT